MNLALIGRVIRIAGICASIVAVGAADEVMAQNQLEMRVAGKFGEYLRVKIPKDTRESDCLVLIYVDPKSGKKPEDVFVVPEGKIDEAINETLKKWNGFGLDAGEVHQPGSTFNNGTFDVVAATNSRKKVGVYAFTQLTDKKTDMLVGAACTYFKVSSWGTEKTEEVEIRLPEAPGGSMKEYLPKRCDLSALLISKDGTWHAFGSVSLDRK